MSSEKSNALQGTLVWPTMLFTRLWDQHSLVGPEVIACLMRLKDVQAKNIDSGIAVGAKSAQGLYESNFDHFDQPDESLQKLVRFIHGSLALAISLANGREVPAEKLRIEIVDSWYHITNQGGYHDAHVHHGCSWCGIYYLQVSGCGQPSGQSAPNGGSRFYCPVSGGGGYRDYGNQYLTSSIDPPIEDGMLLLFPSYLLHSGLPYSGQQDRIVIAFNARCFVER